MQRRKFIAGVGSIAAAGAAATGTGAFSAVRAERDINVQVASDSEAFLELDASVSPYAEETGNTIEFQFNDDAGSSPPNGSGLNDNADTLFNDVLKIKNAGTNAVRLRIGSPDLFSLPDGPMLVSYSDEPLSSTQTDSQGVNATPFSNSPHPSWWQNSPDVTNQDLGVGQDLYLHFGFYLNEETEALDANLDGSSASQDPADIPNNIAIYGDTGTNGSDFT